MFKHILLPTDGSPLSHVAILKTIQLAKALDARVTGFYASLEFHVIASSPDMLEATRQQFEKDSEIRADHYLAEIKKAANEAGVPCVTVHAVSDQPYEAIIKAAEQYECDMISMASHGRSGVQAVLLGSVTQKVLTHSRLPVFVLR